MKPSLLVRVRQLRLKVRVGYPYTLVDPQGLLQVSSGQATCNLAHVSTLYAVGYFDISTPLLAV